MKTIGYVLAGAIAMSGAFVAGATLTQSAIAQTNGSQAANDRGEIENLVAEAVFAYDRKDVQAFGALFTPDAVLRTMPSRNHPEAAEYKGKDVVVFLTKNIRPPAAPVPGAAPAPAPPARGNHTISSNWVKITSPTTAKHYAYFMVGANAPPGAYDDEMVKVNGKWLIKSRTIFYDGVKPSI